MILARNDSCLGELDKLEPSRVDLHVSNNVKSVFFLDLMKASKKWKLEALLMDCFKEIWMTLVHISKVGHIECLLIHPFEPLSLDSEHLRKVWEISKHFGFPRGDGHVFFNRGKNNQLLELGGGSLKRIGSRCCILLKQGSMSRKKEQCEVKLLVTASMPGKHLHLPVPSFLPSFPPAFLSSLPKNIFLCHVSKS